MFGRVTFTPAGERSISNYPPVGRRKMPLERAVAVRRISRVDRRAERAGAYVAVGVMSLADLEQLTSRSALRAGVARSLRECQR